ncbi:MAG: hypothetical protein [Bacteriophage sp.]|nr:MAG: hypothetical protein [Bacteriophage sp.]
MSESPAFNPIRLTFQSFSHSFDWDLASVVKDVELLFLRQSAVIFTHKITVSVLTSLQGIKVLQLASQVLQVPESHLVHGGHCVYCKSWQMP